MFLVKNGLFPQRLIFSFQCPIRAVFKPATASVWQCAVCHASRCRAGGFPAENQTYLYRYTKPVAAPPDLPMRQHSTCLITTAWHSPRPCSKWKNCCCLALRCVRRRCMRWPFNGRWRPALAWLRVIYRVIGSSWDRQSHATRREMHPRAELNWAMP